MSTLPKAMVYKSYGVDISLDKFRTSQTIIFIKENFN